MTFNAVIRSFLEVFMLALPSIASTPTNNDSDGKCELVGTFSLFTQAVLGLLCLSSLIVKRSYEYPARRTWQVWLFDVSKQLIGALGVHVFNLLLSILKSQPQTVAQVLSEPDQEPVDPCDWYFLSIVLDCTVGVYILYLVLLAVNKVCKDYLHITQINSGDYGPDERHPSGKAFAKQLSIYFGSLMVTKFLLYAFVEIFEVQLLWITSHIVLAWLDEYPNEFEIFVVMFVVPIVMNCLQLILVDNIIQSKALYATNHAAARGKSPEADEEQEVENVTKALRTSEGPSYLATD